MNHLSISQAALLSMNQLTAVLIIVISIFIHVEAQDQVRKPPEPFRPSLTVVIGVLAIMFSIVVFIVAYAKFCQTRQLLHQFNPDNQQLHHGLVRSRSRFSGFDRTVIESLPFFRFSSLKGSKEGLECAVCLSKFEDTETLRLLPNCKHAFHMNCIDQWLENHSSCPLCRHKFDAGDVTSFAYSTSLRFSQNPSNLTDDPNLELFVQREQDHHQQLGSSRFSSFRKGKKQEKEKEEQVILVQECNASPNSDIQLLHKVKHKIIVSDIVIKNRWSDVNSSDLLFLSSEMLNDIASERFSSGGTSGRFHDVGHSTTENLMKIKEDIERKRLFESKFGEINKKKLIPTSSSPSTSTYHEKNPPWVLNPDEKRSMSEITNISRFMELSTKNSTVKGYSVSPAGNNGKEERLRKVWLPIAQRTVQWFASGSERSSRLETAYQYKRHGPANV